MTTMSAVQVTEPGHEFTIVEREVPTPDRGEVLIEVEACGICHSDVFVREGLFPGVTYPRIPGHEVVGRIAVVGDDVAGFREGDRVGVGWHGGHCFHCDACRSGDFVNCDSQGITGITRDGGYATWMTASAETLARVPAELDAVHAAPLLCAGLTTFNALRHSGARPGDTVAIQGIGGLGHLGVQFASRMGFHTVAVSGGTGKRDFAESLGADVYLAASETDVAEALQALGGARVILATVPDSAAIGELIDGLGRGGEMIVVGVDADPIPVAPRQLIAGRKTIRGWSSGHAKDAEETLQFAALAGVRPMIETFPLADAEAAYERMLRNEARFRVVLTP